MFRKAIIFMIISAMAFACMNIVVKSFLKFNVYQIVFFRSIGTLCFTLPFLLKQKISIYGNKQVLLVLRGVVGVTSMVLFFLCLKHLKMGSAVTIRYTSPIFATAFGVLLLGEKIKRIQWLFFTIAFSGVLVIKGFDIETDSIGVLYAILSAITAGLVYFIIRRIGDKDHPMVIVNWFMLISACIGGLLSLNNWTQPSGFEWIWLFSLGVFGYVAQLFMTKALQIEKLSQVAPVKYIEVVFTMILGIIWFDESYTIYGLLGILLIITGLILNIGKRG